MPGILLHRPAPGATTCIVIGALPEPREADLSVFRAVLWCIDSGSASPLPASLVSNRVQIVRPDIADTAAVLERFIRFNPRSLPSLILSRSVEGALAEKYRTFITETHRLLESTHRTRFTRQQDGFTWQKHILQNAPAYAKNRMPATWAGALTGTPAFVCGAGPSLDISIRKLAAAANRAVIFAADSSLRALARHGVQADFAVSIDVAKIPDKCLPDELPPTNVILASISPPAWQQAVQEQRRFFLSGHQLTDDWFAQQGVPRTAINVAESCGSTAIELAHHLGCSPIYLFGLDLAVDEANPARRHQKNADPTLYLKSNYDPTAQLPRVPGNYSDTVPCFAFGDWQELDARLAARSDSAVFNVNDRGARLRGTILMHPDHFVLNAPTGSKHEALCQLSSNATDSGSAPETALVRLRDVGETWRGALPSLRRALETGGPAGLAEAFRPILLHPADGRALGAFALKLMPHLVPPIEEDPTLWRTLLVEFEELSALACAARTR